MEYVVRNNKIIENTNRLFGFIAFEFKDKTLNYNLAYKSTSSIWNLPLNCKDSGASITSVCKIIDSNKIMFLKVACTNLR